MSAESSFLVLLPSRYTLLSTLTHVQLRSSWDNKIRISRKWLFKLLPLFLVVEMRIDCLRKRILAREVAAPFSHSSYKYKFISDTCYLFRDINHDTTGVIGNISRLADNDQVEMSKAYLLSLLDDSLLRHKLEVERKCKIKLKYYIIKLVLFRKKHKSTCMQIFFFCSF